MPLSDSLRSRRAELLEEMDHLLERAKARGGFTKTDQRRFEELEAEVKQLEERIEEVAERERREARVAELRARVLAGAPSVGRDSIVGPYRPDGPGFFRDLIAARRGDLGAAERLHEHQVRVTRALIDRGEMQVRDISRTDGAGGEFVPPLWLMDEYAALARASRVTADLVRRLPLPEGTDSISVPRVTGGASVAAQADNQAVSETDMTTGSVTAPVTTIAGQQDASLQLVEQSPAGMDRIIFADLLAAYAAELDRQVITGNGTAPNHRGILNVSGINAVTYTDTSPTVGELYPKLADAISRIATNRYAPAEAIVMHPRRWAWITAALDSQGRPLVTPSAGAASAPVAVSTAPTAEGAVGTMHGLRVYLDANIPTNLGAGTNEDVIIVLRASDLLLFESALRIRVLQEVLSGTLAVRFQLYAYSAFMAGRYPAAISTVGGTGLVVPAL
jgi:HK97 family phage major capsid protein